MGEGVVRARRQVWTVRTRKGGAEVDVVFGVNRYAWIAKQGEEGSGKQVAITRLAEGVSEGMYSSPNDEIGRDEEGDCEAGRVC